MGDPVRLSFAGSFSPPKAVNDDPLPPPAEPPPSPPAELRLTQRLDPGIPREVISKGHRPPLNDGAQLQTLRRRLWDWLDATEAADAKGYKVKQDRALDEVMRIAREELVYPELTRSRAQIAVVQAVLGNARRAGFLTLQSQNDSSRVA